MDFVMCLFTTVYYISNASYVLLYIRERFSPNTVQVQYNTIHVQ